MTTTPNDDRGPGPANPPAVTADDLAALRARLVERAEREGLVDVAYRTVDSPLGQLLVASTAAGLVRVAFEREDHDAVLSSLSSSVSPRVLRSGRGTDTVARQLDDYFHGRRRTFDVDIDLRLIGGFRRTVIASLGAIAYGDTASYASVAAIAGKPRAVRAAASACANNPVPLVVPCHRVVRADGTIGQYLGGTDAKVFLLDLERATTSGH